MEMMLDSHVLMKEDEAEMGVQSEGCGDGLWGERVAILGWVVREVLREDDSGGKACRE